MLTAVLGKNWGGLPLSFNEKWKRSSPVWGEINQMPPQVWGKSWEDPS